MGLWHGISAFWWSLDAPLRAALVGATATVTASAVGVGVVVMQLRRQARNALDQLHRAEAAKLKVHLYEGIVVQCEVATNAGLDLIQYLRAFRMEMQNARTLQQLGALWTLPSARFMQMLALQQTASRSTIALVTSIERWEIIEPRLSVFQTAFNVCIHDWTTAFFGAYSPFAMRLMPAAHPHTGELLPWDLPSVSDEEKLGELASKVTDAVETAGMYIVDFQRETQNLFLGDLFPARVAPRLPMDPRLIAITLDRHKELEKHFSNATAWGRVKREAEGRVQSELDARAAAEDTSL
ncbi:MAG: hypothetical protein JWO58_3364 [Chitinophagaceae bacterium]|nr:hypothetical protein [Chitinophagaceae bacterium]